MPRPPDRFAHVVAVVTGVVVAVLITAACGSAQQKSHDTLRADTADSTRAEFPGSVQVVAVPEGAVPAVIESVVDGDTITVALDPEGGFHAPTQIIRLLGIDTPEKSGGPRPAECHGNEATAFAESLMPIGTAILLAADQETRDQYGRLLAYVFRADDGLFVNHALVANGHATTLFFAPNTAMRAPLSTAAHRAREAGAGFWATCDGLPHPIADSS